MPEKEVQPGKKPYRVFLVEGKISWRIEELWDGGVVRGPYGSKEGAIRNEEKIAREKGFIDALVLQEVVGEETSPANAFRKEASGDWHCVQGCSINFENENKEIVFTEGMTFSKGTPFMGVDVAKWLDEHAKQ
jgi:hypothetical protein